MNLKKAYNFLTFYEFDYFIDLKNNVSYLNDKIFYWYNNKYNWLLSGTIDYDEVVDSGNGVTHICICLGRICFGFKYLTYSFCRKINH